MNFISTRFSIFILVNFLLLGCAAPDPQRTYVAKSNDAKLIVRSVNMPMNVQFSVSSSAQTCEGFESIGVISDSGRGVLLPWIADLVEKINNVPRERQVAIPAGQLVQVKGYGKWMGGGSSGHCGPLVAKFVVESPNTYLVEFVWAGVSACSMRVSDISVPSEPRPVPVERAFCPRPWYDL